MGMAWMRPHKWRQDEPNSFEPLKYDPQFGFLLERPERDVEFPATQEEMDSAGIPPEARDFCVKYRIDTKACYKKHFPFGTLYCPNVWHAEEECLHAENYYDMRDFERERRLNRRERLLTEKERYEAKYGVSK